MPRTPALRNTNGKRRRDSVRNTSRSSRAMALNATQQVALRAVHYEIGSLQLILRQLISTVGILQVAIIQQHESSEFYQYIQHCLLGVMGYYTGCLFHYYRMDSTLADINEDEERANQRARRRPL